VYAGKFPDPGALIVDGTWYAYGTNGPAGNVPVLTSPDLLALRAAEGTFASPLRDLGELWLIYGRKSPRSQTGTGNGRRKGRKRE
jgi:hypothetical protein